MNESGLQDKYRADLRKKPQEVAEMFDRVARRYDLTNDVLSVGQVRIWRRTAVKTVDPQPGEVLLDLAAGTGSSTNSLAESGAKVYACDLSDGMLEVGRKRYPHLDFVQGNATELPFADDSFDAVTISFGLRNVEEVEGALQEMYRVTKPGGRLVIAEFSTPPSRLFRAVYYGYLERVLPRLARVFSSNDIAYHYLTESIREWPAQESLGQLIYEQGWRQVAFRNLAGGAVALHRAIKV